VSLLPVKSFVLIRAISATDMLESRLRFPDELGGSRQRIRHGKGNPLGDGFRSGIDRKSYQSDVTRNPPPGMPKQRLRCIGDANSRHQENRFYRNAGIRYVRVGFSSN
jgi:hypothetical protein